MSAARLVLGAANAFASESTLLEMQSQTQGFLMPVMSTTARTAIASPAEGLMVYDVTLHAPYVYSNGAWSSLQTAGQPLVPGFTVHTNVNGSVYAPTANQTPNVVLNGNAASQTVYLPASPIQGQMVTFTQLTGTITTLTLNPSSGATIIPAAPTTLVAGNFITYLYVELGPSKYWVRVAGNI